LTIRIFNPINYVTYPINARWNDIYYMKKRHYDPYSHSYSVGDLVIYKGEFLSDKDEVGIIVAVVDLLHDGMLIYEVETSSGRDIMTQFDAQWLLEPYDEYKKKCENRKKAIDKLRKLDILPIGLDDD